MLKFLFFFYHDVISALSRTRKINDVFWFIFIIHKYCSMIILCGNFQLNLGCSRFSSRRAVWGEGWTAAGSLWSSVGKSTYCTSLGKVTDMAVCPCHLSLELHTSTKTKGEPGHQDNSKAPACYCPEGLLVNVGPLIIRPRVMQPG